MQPQSQNKVKVPANSMLKKRFSKAFSKGCKSIGDLKANWRGDWDCTAPHNPQGREICLKGQLTGECKARCGRKVTHIS